MRTPADAPGDCPDADALSAYLEHRLGAEPRRAMEAHIDGCELCRQVIAHQGAATPRAADVPTTTPSPEQAASPARVRPRLARGDTLGRYEIRDWLGAGGMSMVYLARDTHLKRDIALKLLRVVDDDGDDGGDGSAADRERRATRLVREAEAMARLAHPNVVALHDCGIFDGQVYLTMEAVRGRSLDRWLRARRRTWREVVAVFLQAAAGLAAAHDAGIVHRDFKPSNVLVGDDDRARVTDFGLAQLAEEPLPAPTALPPARASHSTRTGALLGTPAYVAPEQRVGKGDARSDQYSFCVALHEALYGRRPGGARTPSASTGDHHTPTSSAANGPPPARGRIPRRVQRALERGLREDPAQRFSSMHELATALTPRRSARGLALGVGASLAAALAIGLGLRADEPAASCADSDAPVVAVWPGQRSAVEAHLRAVSGLGPDAATPPAILALDDYGRALARAHVDTCEATYVRRQQSEELFDLRTACLRARGAELAAVVELLGSADVALAGRATHLTRGLPPLAPCADREALRSRTPRPEDPAARARIAVLEAQLGEVRALVRAGRLGELAAVVEPLARAADEVAWPPLQAAAQYELGKHRWSTEGPQAAEPVFHRALRHAELAGDDRLRAEILATLIGVLGFSDSRFDEALQVAELARAAIVRTGGDDALLAGIEGNIGSAHYGRGNYGAALEHYQRALALVRGSEDAEAHELASALGNVGIALSALRRPEEALPYAREALEIRERHAGPNHPAVSLSLGNLAQLHLQQGDYQQAESALERALAIDTAVFGERSHELTGWLSTLGILELNRERYQQALTHFQRALAIWDSIEKPGIHPAEPRAGLGHALVHLQRPGEAIEPLEHALRTWREADAAHPMQGIAHLALARALAATGGPPARIDEHARAAIAFFEQHDMAEELQEARAFVAGR